MTGAVTDELLGPGAAADPYPIYAGLREHAPVHWSPRHRAWLVTRYADVSAAFADKALSNDRVRPVLERRRAEGKPDAAPGASERVLGMLADWMVVTDPPAHTRLRKLAAGAFKGQRISAMDERITALVDELLDDVAGRTDALDLIAEVAYPLPATVIATMLGAPPQDRDRFRDWSDELALVAFGAGGDARADRHERALAGLREMDGYFRELVARRRAEPTEDMLSALIAGREGTDALSDDELVGMCALLLFAGHETTTNSIANGVLALLRHPGELARLRAEPELRDAAVEELLRFDGPIKVLNRWVVAETTLGGQLISPGERVHLVLGAANRDPARFDDPDALDLSRSPNPHVAFGKGIHACIGAQLARTETRIAIARIVERLPRLELAAEPEWKDALASRAMEALWVYPGGRP